MAHKQKRVVGNKSVHIAQRKLAKRPPLPYGPAHFTVEQIREAVAKAKQHADAAC